MLPEAAGDERNTGLRAITAPSYKHPSKLSQLQNTQFNSLTVTFLATFMHQSIPAVPILPPPGNRGAFVHVVSPGGGASAILSRPEG